MVDMLTLDSSLFYIGTMCGISGSFIPFFVKMFLQVFIGETEIEANLRRQKCDLEAELGSISMIDEFAKYAKIKRKLNKVTNELSHQADMRTSYAMKIRLVSSGILYVFLAVTMSIILWSHKNVAVVILPENWLHPCGYLLSYPSKVSGGISLVSWLFISSAVGKVMAASL